MYELEEKWYLYFLIVIPIMTVLFLYIQMWKKKKQLDFGDLELINRLSPNKSTFKSVLKLSLLVVSLTLLIIGLVNPKIGTKLETVKREGIDIIFAIDVSKSMLAEDVAPSRLEKGKQLVSQIINNLGADRIGIIAYSGSAFPVLPITSDYNVGKMFLQTMNPGMISSQGTSIDQAISLASTYIDKKDKTNKLLIIISDGEDHSEAAQEAAQEAKKVGLKIMTIGVGTENGGTIPLKINGEVESLQRDQENNVVITKRNEEILKSIAKNTGGGYVDGNSTKNVLEYVKNALDNIQKTEFESTQMADFKSQFQWFLGFGFFLLYLDIFVLEKKTNWVKKMNLFNEKEN